MASRFEMVDEEYIEELKDKSENEKTKKSSEWWKNIFKKWANERNLEPNLEEYENMSSTNDCRSLKHSETQQFAFYVTNKSSQWILVKLRNNITCVFRSNWNCPRRCATREKFLKTSRDMRAQTTYNQPTCVVYNYQCDAEYVGYTSKHFKNDHGLETIGDVTNNFSVLKKCNGKLNCLINEMSFIKKKRPCLNTQSDSLHVKLFSI